MAGAGGGEKTVPLTHQKPISCNAQDGVMVKAAPAVSFFFGHSIKGHFSGYGSVL
jgi:hypothetical protein